MQDTSTKPGPLGWLYGRRRFTILAGMLLFLAPFAFIPQLAGEVNMCGAVCPRMFFILPAGDIAAGLSRAVSAEWFGVGLVGAILGATLLFGRLWCGRFCPIGGTAELVSRLVPDRLKLNYSAVKAPAFRYAYFAIFVAGTWLGLGGISCKLCNFRVIPFLAGAPFVPGYRTYLLSSIGLAGLLTVLASGFLARGGRAYCNLLCPVGALDGLMNFLGSRLPFARRMRVDERLCVGCGVCTDSCMVWALEVPGTKLKRDQLSCMSCGECERACPLGAIGYGKP
jgi:ferredoxin